MFYLLALGECKHACFEFLFSLPVYISWLKTGLEFQFLGLLSQYLVTMYIAVLCKGLEEREKGILKKHSENFSTN